MASNTLVLPLFALGLLAQHTPAQSAYPAAATRPITDSPRDSVNELKSALEQVQAIIRKQSQQLDSQRLQLEHQQFEIDQLRRQFAGSMPPNTSAAEQAQLAASSAAMLNNELHVLRGETPVAPSSQPLLRPAVLTVTSAQQATGAESGDKPLSVHFGNASLTPGGWVDFTGYYRSSDVGSGLGTSFASIPFKNTVLGGLSETRFSAQNSRIMLRADEKFGSTRVFGYAEADFNGYLPSNGYVSTNAGSLRLRVFFTDLQRGRWELLGGQSWSLLTPNRTGVSPFLSEIYNTLHLDTNYQVGLTYARQPQLRAVYHFTPRVALGLSAESPQQYSGSAATFPALFSTTETDLGSSTGAGGGTSTPNLHPDVIAKLSGDAGWRRRKWHFETSGLLTSVAILTPASVTKARTAKDIREGGGIAAAANLAVARHLHLILTGFWSDGGGRYIGGLGPAFVVAQPGSRTSPFVAQLVHSGSGIAGLEWQATHATLLSATFSSAYFGRRYSTDPTTGNLVGYGFTGSANSSNRTIHEGTFATQTTLWKQPEFGSVQVITQSSYITRTPWYVGPGAPGNAHVFSGYANLRYELP